ncbi:restriction endonuclease PLD domain-containing protein, partial [Rodentibacter ratti]|uniref:restriction endonuclease PLD domain-containing protein n=1 Tax=Rodentibacter ratti TaxID=1906745 RepID=UPI00117A70E7
LNMEEIEQTLLDEFGALPQRSGLNWGQREGRRPNEAYIKVSSSNYSFFPIDTQFEIRTKDGHSFICAIAQQGGKAIHTPHDNCEFGRYFRNKLGVPLGSPISISDLTRYGRTSVTFSKINSNTYMMDF